MYKKLSKNVCFQQPAKTVKANKCVFNVQHKLSWATAIFTRLYTQHKWDRWATTHKTTVNWDAFLGTSASCTRPLQSLRPSKVDKVKLGRQNFNICQWICAVSITFWRWIHLCIQTTLMHTVHFTCSYYETVHKIETQFIRLKTLARSCERKRK